MRTWMLRCQVVFPKDEILQTVIIILAVTDLKSYCLQDVFWINFKNMVWLFEKNGEWYNYI